MDSVVEKTRQMTRGFTFTKRVLMGFNFIVMVGSAHLGHVHTQAPTQAPGR